MQHESTWNKQTWKFWQVRPLCFQIYLQTSEMTAVPVVFLDLTDAFWFSGQWSPVSCGHLPTSRICSSLFYLLLAAPGRRQSWTHTLSYCGSQWQWWPFWAVGGKWVGSSLHLPPDWAYAGTLCTKSWLWKLEGNICKALMKIKWSKSLSISI